MNTTMRFLLSHELSSKHEFLLTSITIVSSVTLGAIINSTDATEN